jgi:hypothetical protein
MQIVDKANGIGVAELEEMSRRMFDPIVKAVVDVERRVVAIDASLHSDLEMYLLENGSEQTNLWGINFWSEHYGGAVFVEFDSLINLRPYQNNRSRGVDDAATRELILEIVSEAVSA